MKKLILAGMLCVSAFFIYAVIQDMGTFIVSQEGDE